MSNPWTSLSAQPDLLLVTAPIPERGRYYHRLRTIVLRQGMSLVEQRSTLWHELCHADRGDEPGHELDSERRTVREAARRAIGVHDLADALLWSEHPAEQADQLKVTEDLLAARLEHLHPAERGYLRRRLSMKEQSA